MSKQDSWQRIDGQWVKVGYEDTPATPTDVAHERHIDQIAAQLTHTLLHAVDPIEFNDIVYAWLQFREEIRGHLEAETGVRRLDSAGATRA